MSEEERLAIAVLYLGRIKAFGHKDGCPSHAPVYECGCYGMDQGELAAKALEEMGYD